MKEDWMKNDLGGKFWCKSISFSAFMADCRKNFDLKRWKEEKVESEKGFEIKENLVKLFKLKLPRAVTVSIVMITVVVYANIRFQSSQ